MKSSTKELVMPPLVLTIICIVITAALAVTYSITQPIIDIATQKAADAARAIVLPGATSFELLTVDEMPENGINAYKDNDGNGYVVTTGAKGYGGLVTVMTGIKNDGTIAGVTVLDHTETQGLGTKAAEPSYLDAQYVGKDQTLEGVETIGGATVTSKAVLKAVGSAFQVYGKAAGVEIVVPGNTRPAIDDAVKTELFPNVTEFTKLDVDGEAYKAGEEGYIIVVSEDGFIGAITTAVSFDNNGVILGAVMTANEETPTYGAELNTVSYLKKLVGVTAPDQIETISGATVSSTAFVKSMTTAFELFPTLKDAGAIYEGTATGYAGELTVEVGVDAAGVITSVALGKNDETDGIGSQCGEEAFTSQFVGKTSVEGIETISGATVTSKAMMEAVQQVLDTFAQKGA